MLPSPIVTHPALGKAKHRKVIVVQHLGHRPLRMVFGDECLHISSEVVYDHQHVLHYGLPVSRYGNFHSDVVDMDEFHWFGADDRLHRWELAFSLILNTSPAVGYGFQQGLGHTQPPKPFFHKAQGAVTALVPRTMVATVYGGLPVCSQNDKDRHCILAIGGGGL